jgi:hypothetical protein
MTEPQIHNAARIAGFDLSLPQLQVEMPSVVNRNHAAQFKPLGGKRYRITELGESKLAEAGL